MSKFVNADTICYAADAIAKEEYSDDPMMLAVIQGIKDLMARLHGIDIVPCRECRRVREDGGHANCNGYLYCRKWKTLVDEDSYCSWGEREGE